LKKTGGTGGVLPKNKGDFLLDFVLVLSNLWIGTGGVLPKNKGDFLLDFVLVLSNLIGTGIMNSPCPWISFMIRSIRKKSI
jgi:hypothetical protein